MRENDTKLIHISVSTFSENSVVGPKLLVLCVCVLTSLSEREMYLLLYVTADELSQSTSLYKLET